MKKFCIYALAMLALTACENMGGLYPVTGDTSTEIPAHFSWSGTGSGTVTFSMPGGEVMSGNFGPAYNNPNFGGIFKAVYGQYSTLPVAANNGAETAAILKGNRGTSMQCEFYNDDYKNHGFGGCRTSTGTLYRLKY